MAFLDLSGTLAGLKVLDDGDRDRYKAAVRAGEQTGFGYYWPHLLAQHRPGSSAVLVAEDGDSLCLFRWRVRDARARLDLYLPPLPPSLPVLARCLERANAFNGDRSARIVRIDEKDAGTLSEHDRLRLEPRRMQYLYRPETYLNLSGNNLRTLRRQVARVEGLSRVEVLPYSEEHAEDCRALLRRWRDRHRAAHGTEGGAGTARRALELAGRLREPDMRGEVILVDGRLAGFAFGGEIRPGVGCFFEAKSDEDVPGLAYFQRRSFLLRLRDFDLVNDGSDAGRPGLRQLKDSLRPARMHAEYRGIQRRR
ncbi:MAG TPA: phosphatidylglycerol lysyltransferase domain-containing protein [Candidatus Polarisedimenticolaceae bacterium]